MKICLKNSKDGVMKDGSDIGMGDPVNLTDHSHAMVVKGDNHANPNSEPSPTVEPVISPGVDSYAAKLTEGIKKQRKELWKDLQKHSLFVKNRPWPVLGDFNETLSVEDNAVEDIQKLIDSNPYDISLRESEARYLKEFEDASYDEELFLK
ncbi:hypothetical protein QVD17_41646 [Tagetes erecta]|uniref:Uncharacterized protein n=1 Tax=Tagetes erecta TaxID=13708 RepID=A0AAD8NEZ6_TARER|nr:hypothetical protein QVD17_41646 [Tagetes erecta]